MSGATLALGSSLVFGVSDFVGGTTSRRIGALELLFFTQWIQLALAAIWVVVGREQLPDATALAAATGAGVGMTFSAIAFFQAMVVGKMSVVTPIAATGVILPVAAGIGGGERPSAAQVVGIIAAVIGVALAARSREERLTTRTESGIGLALVAAIGGGLFLWLMAPAGRQAAAWSLLVVRAIPVVVLSVVVSARRTPLRPALANAVTTRILVVGLLSFSAISLYALATQHGQLTIVSVLGSLWPAIVVLLAYRFLGERLASAQRFGVVIVLGAVVLLST